MSSNINMYFYDDKGSFWQAWLHHNTVAFIHLKSHSLVPINKVTVINVKCKSPVLLWSDPIISSLETINEWNEFLQKSMMAFRSLIFLPVTNSKYLIERMLLHYKSDLKQESMENIRTQLPEKSLRVISQRSHSENCQMLKSGS